MFVELARTALRHGGRKSRFYNYLVRRTRDYLGTRKGLPRIYTGYNKFPGLPLKTCWGSVGHRTRRPGLLTEAGHPVQDSSIMQVSNWGRHRKFYILLPVDRLHSVATAFGFRASGCQLHARMHSPVTGFSAAERGYRSVAKIEYQED